MKLARKVSPVSLPPTPGVEELEKMLSTRVDTAVSKKIEEAQLAAAEVPKDG